MRNKFLTVAALLLGGAFLMSGVASSAPISNFSWTAPTNYEDGSVLDTAVDPLTYTIYCGTTQGGPYTTVFDAGVNTTTGNIDVGACVNGVPGTYYFVATATSSVYNEESGFSGEASRTYTASELGKVPQPPVLISVQ